jgi:hypothetical protein
MISHARFGALRLAQFLPDAEIAELENWEFMYHVWLGEAVGFSEWLRLENDPGVLRSLAIDFTDFPEHAAAEVLRTNRIASPTWNEAWRVARDTWRTSE